MKVRLVSYTQPAPGSTSSGPEDLVAYCARVSSSRPEASWADNYGPLLKYLKKHSHWSPFEMVDATVDITAPRDITRQMLRHRSFSFQEFSQRYSDRVEMRGRMYREQDVSNRQNSTDTFSAEEQDQIKVLEREAKQACEDAYLKMRMHGVAKECARVVLPEGLTESRLFMKGSLRSWIHYLDLRSGNGTQKEHVQVAEQIAEVLLPVFPTILRKEEKCKTLWSKFRNSARKKFGL